MLHNTSSKLLISSLTFCRAMTSGRETVLLLLELCREGSGEEKGDTFGDICCGVFRSTERFGEGSMGTLNSDPSESCFTSEPVIFKVRISQYICLVCRPSLFSIP